MPGGKPIEDFLFDPPVLMNAEALGIKSLGVTAIESNGVIHLIDVVGSKFYPNVADFIEEVRRLGLSRKIASNFNFSQLTWESRIIVMHRRAFIKNAGKYASTRPCPKGHDYHDGKPKAMCARLWWEDVEGGEPIEGEARKVKRQMPSFSYECMSRPEGVEPQYELAAFASFPIHGIEVVKDLDNNKHVKSLEAARKAKVNVKLVDE